MFVITTTVQIGNMTNPALTILPGRMNELGIKVIMDGGTSRDQLSNGRLQVIRAEQNGDDAQINNRTRMTRI